ncbi:hypothetical protein OAA60_03470 [Porticoccaceae bacterium]|nr:hypothetical protein [Porticoccaceae bacterium]
MATFKDEFVALSNELINDEFADFKRPLVISKSGKYDPISNTESPDELYNLEAIPLDIASASVIFANVTNDSIYIVAYKGDTSPQELDSSYTCVYDGKNMTIDAVENDPADAAWFMQLAK